MGGSPPPLYGWHIFCLVQRVRLGAARTRLQLHHHYKVRRRGPEVFRRALGLEEFFRDSNDALDWLHERMPAILPDFESVRAWLDPDLKGADAVDVLEPVERNEVPDSIHGRSR
jgi:hypothetical protein